MKQNKEGSFSFLRSRLAHKYIVRAFVFGSFATDKMKPNDCDIFIVTNQAPGERGWIEFVELIEGLKVDFQNEFGLPLNASINTEKEFLEVSAFKTRILEAKIVEIIG